MLKEEIETSESIDAVVLILNAVSEKANPIHITFLEIYVEVYKAHLQTGYFFKQIPAQRIWSSLSNLSKLFRFCPG
ncbi:MAG: hypothetical protein ABIS01_06945, partial [Ferruginibacter sp.]